jgi:mRNA interferase YafQ
MPKIEFSKPFQRKFKFFVVKYPTFKSKLEKVFRRLTDDPHQPSLKTHKLHGELKDFYSCTVDYDHRLIFEVKGDIIRLTDIGSHDEVY